ncbi:MAG: FAD-dependent oxidoreductase [Calothrix sp. SM1_5_4]|nr:FAD-dependent oxidoreductase [Calothrix sp. SM1_5_4]
MDPGTRPRCRAHGSRNFEPLCTQHIQFRNPPRGRSVPLGRPPETCALVRIAARYGLPLHPVSRGRNWGYGDACAPTDHQVIVDLSRMNRILEFDAELGYARIEAGVSQGDLYNYLVERDLPYWMDATAAGPTPASSATPLIAATVTPAMATARHRRAE